MTTLDNATTIWEQIYDGSQVWEGSLTELCQGFDFSKARFDKAWRLLKVSECIEVSRSGNRYERSLVRILRPPTGEDLERFRLTDSRVSAKIEQRMSDLARLIGGVNLVELEARVTRLEHKLNTTEGDQE